MAGFPKGRSYAAISLCSCFFTVPVCAADAQDLVITPSRIDMPIARAGSAVTIIPREEIERYGSLGLASVLQSVPGLYVYEAGGLGGLATVSLRGASAGQSVILLDGMRLNDPTGTDASVDLTSIPVTDIERIEVLRGPQSALYGSDAMGGVINIITRKGSSETKRSVTLEAGSHGTGHARGSISGAQDGVAYAFSADYLHSDAYPHYGYRITNPVFSVTAPTVPKHAPMDRLGLRGRVNWNAGDVEMETRVAAFANRGKMDNGYAYNATENVYSNFNRLRAFNSDLSTTGSAYAFDGQLKNKVSLFLSTVDRLYGLTESCADYTTNCTSYYRGVRVGTEYQGDWKTAPLGVLSFGLRSERETADVSYDPETAGASTYTPISKSQTTNSLFSIYQFTPAKNTDLSVGGRVDSVLNGDRFVTWRTTASYRFDESDTKIHSSIGTGAKIATLYQRYSEYGISTLKSEKSIGYDFGVDQKITDRLTASVSVFENRFENLIAYTSGATGCLSTYGCYYNVGLAKTRGAEVAGDLIVVPEAWRTRLSYTNLWSRDLSTQKELLQRPRHKTTLAVTYTGIPKLELETRLTYVGVRYDYSSSGDARLDPFTKIDLYGSYKLRESLTVFSRLENLTNGRYQEAYQFGAAGRSLYGGLRMTW